MSSVRRSGPSVGDAVAAIRRLPIRLSMAVAVKAAPALTAELRGDFAAGRTAYGDARPEGVDGQPLTLVKTGATQRALAFAATGTRVRAVLATRYAKYLIGKYRVMPPGRAAMPVAWRRLLNGVVQSIGLRELGL